MVIGGFRVGTACACNNNHSNVDETAGTLLTSSDTPLVAESLDVSRVGFSVSIIHHSLVIPQRTIIAPFSTVFCSAIFLKTILCIGVEMIE